MKAKHAPHYVQRKNKNMKMVDAISNACFLCVFGAYLVVFNIATKNACFLRLFDTMVEKS